MLDGSLETRVSASGYLQGGYWNPTQDQHGTRINKRSSVSLHYRLNPLLVLTCEITPALILCGR